MDFIAMDLIGEFHPPSSQGNRYALTGICMLTGFTWCIPLKSKKAAEVSRAYLQHVYSVLGGSTKILTDNGTEFKNEIFREMLQKLGTEKLIHSPPYRPQSNRRIEGFHRYLKACMAKYMCAGLEWDEVTAMATAAYNYFPNMSAKESALQSAFYWFPPCLDLLPVALLFAYVFPGFLVPRCALLFWGIFVRGLHVETFVRVLRSSRCRLLIKCK